MRSLKKYLITLLIGFGLTALVIYSKDIFAQTQPMRVFHILCDAFTVSGWFITAAGLLVFASNEGTFDGLIYGVSSFVNIFRKKSVKKYDTYYDYKESRGKNKTQFGFMLICGLFFLAVAAVMYLMYRKYS